MEGKGECMKVWLDKFLYRCLIGILATIIISVVVVFMNMLNRKIGNATTPAIILQVQIFIIYLYCVGLSIEKIFKFFKMLTK